MRMKLELLGDVLRVDVRERETAEETREIAEAVLAERDKLGVLAILISSKDSRPIFKVEEFRISELFDRALAIPGLRVAAATDDRALHAAHEYVELLAAQRGVPFRAFTSEREALAWLRSGAA